MADDAIKKAAKKIRDAYKTGRPIKPVRETLPKNDVAAAYAVQQANTDLWIEQGRRVIGRKIGLTAKAVQKQLGVDQPDYGILFADMAVVDGDDCVGSLSETLMARVLEDAALLDRPVSEVMSAPFPVVDAEVPIDRLVTLLSKETPAALIREGGRLIGIVNRYDVLREVAGIG